MAGNTKDAWEEVGNRFSGWGRLLSEHYQEIDRARGGPGSEEDRRKLEEAIQTAARQLDVAFTSLGETLRDPEAKQRLGSAARALRDAMVTTVSEAGERIRKGTTSSSTEPSSVEEPTRPPEPPAATGTPDAEGPEGEAPTPRPTP